MERAPRTSTRQRLGLGLQRYGSLVALVILMIVAALLSPNFLTESNIRLQLQTFCLSTALIGSGLGAWACVERALMPRTAGSVEVGGMRARSARVRAPNPGGEGRASTSPGVRVSIGHMATPAAEVEVTEGLVRALLREQHPDLADLALVEVASGWDNLIYRLGDALSVRLPRRATSAVLIEHEQRWLPQLGVGLPLPVPVPLRVGVPGCGYPWPWTISTWLPGRSAELDPPEDLELAAVMLGAFLRALHQPAPADAPHNPYRGVPLEERSDRLVAGLDLLAGSVDRVRVMERWSVLVQTPAWPGPPLWLHGDVHPLNLLVHDGRLSAVIDFGDVTAGDPASDLAVGWMLFGRSSREIFRASDGADPDTWARAEAWALALGVAMAAGDDRVAVIGRRTVAAVLAVPD